MRPAGVQPPHRAHPRRVPGRAGGPASLRDRPTTRDRRDRTHRRATRQLRRRRGVRPGRRRHRRTIEPAPIAVSARVCRARGVELLREAVQGLPLMIEPRASGMVRCVPRTTQSIHIAGAGIGGLTAAVALQRQGVTVVVHESARALAPLGAGLSLWPNGGLALESLGVSGLRGGSIPRGGAGLCRWDGVPLAVDAGDAIEQRYGAPLVLLPRAELQHALLEALAPGIVHLDEAIASYEQTDDGVLLHLADGSTAEGDLL